MERKKTIFERHPFVTLSVTVVFAVIFFDLLLGLVLIPQDYNSFREAHFYYHHGLKPNQEAITRWGPITYKVCTNSLGFRDAAPREVPLETSKRRILFMGDSHTEAVGVSYEESLAGRLNAMLDSSKVEILNAAAVSYSPKLYYLKTKYLIEEVGLKFDELFVFIDISDVQNEIAYEHYEPGAIEGGGRWVALLGKWLRRVSYACYSCHEMKENYRVHQFDKLRGKEQIERLHPEEKAESERLEVNWRLYALFFSHFGEEEILRSPEFHSIGEWYGNNPKFAKWREKGLELCGKNMARLAALCRQHKIPMTIAVHPWPELVKNRELDSLQARFWRDFAREHGAGFVNLFPLFISEEDPEMVMRKYYIPGDVHFNAAGYRRVAEFFIRHIE